MKCPKCGHVQANPGSVKGGKKSRRVITDEEQEKMQAARRLAKEKSEQTGGQNADR